MSKPMSEERLIELGKWFRGSGQAQELIAEVYRSWLESYGLYDAADTLHQENHKLQLEVLAEAKENTALKASLENRDTAFRMAFEARAEKEKENQALRELLREMTDLFIHVNGKQHINAHQVDVIASVDAALSPNGSEGDK